ncbi:hypothetical protein ACIG3E_14565 [Streptomyces sp. NPDC053474]|uniref:hypothetical protein n=1 Tax=Streptomyces sp. NPDC053474 TaxID=3365704 RepID=UPI0037CF19FF
MGKASRKKRERLARRTPPAAAAHGTGRGDPRAVGEQALERLLRSNKPGKLSLAGAYAFGYAGLGFAQQEGTDPDWWQETDPLDVLFLGTAWPRNFRDEFEFANARDAWLRLLRGTVHGKGILRFVREAVSASEELGIPVDDGELLLALVGRLEAAGLDERRLPRRLLPDAALQGCRAVFGPSPELRFPEPPKDAKKRVRRFWKAMEEDVWPDGTPQGILCDGLRRFHEAGLPVQEESGALLPALYAALMAKPGEPLEDMGEHASMWALSLDEASPLVPVLDVLLVAPGLEMSVSETLGCLFAMPAFTEPIPSEALLWTSSPGLALPRLAFELGISKVSMQGTVVTPDLLDWAGMHTRMRLNAARLSAADLDEPDDIDDTDSSQDEPDERWTERREAVRDAVLHKLRKKSREATGPQHHAERAGERIWNADGSSVIRMSPKLQNDLERQLEFFREKFGREPGPGDPVFFDPDADEPTRLTREHFDNKLLEMAGRAAEIGIDPAFLHAWREVGYVVTEENRSLFTMAEVLAFSRAVTRHQQAGA